MVVRIFHLDSGGEDAAVVGWVFNLVHRVGCLESVVDNCHHLRKYDNKFICSLLHHHSIAFYK